MAESSSNLSIEQVFHNDLQQYRLEKATCPRNERVRQISHGIIGMDDVHRHGYRQVLGRGLGIIQ